MQKLSLLAVALTFAITGFGRAAQAQDVVPVRVPARSVNVVGESVIRVAPDVAIIRFGVVTQDADPAQARLRNAQAAAEAINAIRQLGIPENNIQLETLRLEPRYEWDPQTQRQREIGYEAIRDVVVRLEDLDKLPNLVAQVVEEGANRLHGIQYDLKDRDAVRNEALRAALLNAREKAQLMASTLGVSVGDVLTISERHFDYPRPIFARGMDAAALKVESAEAVPEAYAAGEIEVRAMVDVAFAIR